MASIVMLAMVFGQIKEAEPAVAVLASLGAIGLALMATKVRSGFETKAHSLAHFVTRM